VPDRPPSAPGLDFVVVGAAKAGTTALFNLLRAHPELHLPERKELPYFAFPSHDYYDSAAAYYADAFRERRPGQLCGTVTPQYLYGALLGREGGRDETAIPRRIHDAYPEARLIAVLRDPVARARSYHRMSRMRGQDPRPFDRAITELLEPAALAESRARPTVKNSYVMLGEYGRLLRGYLEAFPREQLLVLFHEDLERDPAAACEAVFSFIGVDPGFRPANLGRRYNEAGSRRRSALLDLTKWQRAAARSAAMTRLWRRLPAGLRRRALHRFNVAVWRLFLWNRVAVDSGADPDPASAETLARLRQHYREDGRLLRELLGTAPPWQRSERGGERARPTA
jgi:Sulfotransferase domain